MAALNLGSALGSGGLSVNGSPTGAYNYGASSGSLFGPVNPSSGFQQYSPPSGSVMGASTGPSGSGGGSPAPANTAPSGNNNNNNQQAPDPYAAIKSDISNSWDTYLNGLGGVQNDLNNQQTAQRGVADTQLTAGQNALNTQKAQSLRDIGNTTRNAFQAGNNYLGSLGAGDSSAANQYAFAINQQAGKQTGDLNNFVSSKMQDLQTNHDQQINNIANWFSQQQEALKQQIAQGGLQKGQDLANLSKNILDQAMQATNAIKANTQNQYNALVQWAANNSQNVGQLQQNIAQIPQTMGQMQTFGGPGSTSFFGGQGGTPVNQNKTNIFGQPYQ